jgi:hypothetical protein
MVPELFPISGDQSASAPFESEPPQQCGTGIQVARSIERDTHLTA